jgi:hypothetical protein
LPQYEDGTPSVVAMMACGSAAGLTAQTLTFPTDTVRHRMQANGIGGMVRAAGAPRGTLPKRYTAVWARARQKRAPRARHSAQTYDV